MTQCDPDTKVVKLSASALKVAAPRRKRETRKLRGGATEHASVESLQTPPAFVKDQGSIHSAMANFGPEKIQQGGKQKGAGYVDSLANARTDVVGAALKMIPGAQVAAQKGGDSTGAVTQLASTRAPGGDASVVPYTKDTPSGPAPAGLSGGASVKLVPPKQKTKITLKAPKKHGPLKHVHKSRKIALRTRGVTARISKAKKLMKNAHEAPIKYIKATLEKHGVIKKDSKAPEKMLRDMYADLLITKKGM
jgi:hypothetical protein